MNNAHCLVCELIKSRAELLQKAVLVSKYRQYLSPLKTLETLTNLRAGQTYQLADCCAVNHRRLLESGQALELEIARLKLRVEQVNVQEEFHSMQDTNLRSISRLA
ncbi:MAG: hypothetical protein Q7L07_18270 [Pseudohongiella sp.]|nr:hypothetical protein [Pseudohongiella sp.]